MRTDELLFKGIRRPLGFWVLSLEEVLAWYDGCSYKGHTIKRTDTGWFLVVRALRDGHKVVCFYSADSVSNCFAMLATDVNHNKIPWRNDKY